LRVGNVAFKIASNRNLQRLADHRRQGVRASVKLKPMRNPYSITTNQAAIIALFRVMNRYVGNLRPMPGVFPIIRRPLFATPAPSANWR
jgi:hypothetical protein